jgi:hypothetical protein
MEKMKQQSQLFPPGRTALISSWSGIPELDIKKIKCIPQYIQCTTEYARLRVGCYYPFRAIRSFTYHSSKRLGCVTFTLMWGKSRERKKRKRYQRTVVFEQCRPMTLPTFFPIARIIIQRTYTAACMQHGPFMLQYVLCRVCMSHIAGFGWMDGAVSWMMSTCHHHQNLSFRFFPFVSICHG